MIGDRHRGEWIGVPCIAAVRRRSSGTGESPSTSYPPSVRLPVPLMRLAYRSAYAALRGYWFVRRPAVAGVKCVLTDRDLVLLVKHTYGDRGWDLPGGSLKRGELPIEAARREMGEELGVVIDDWVPLGRLLASMHHRRDTMYCYRAELRNSDITVDRGELAAVRWFPRRELPADLGQNVRRILARTAG
jgi:8-oxo-dGTP pyrophosphatase MutT (NUDIX family)